MAQPGQPQDADPGPAGEPMQRLQRLRDMIVPIAANPRTAPPDSLQRIHAEVTHTFECIGKTRDEQAVCIGTGLVQLLPIDMPTFVPRARQEHLMAVRGMWEICLKALIEIVFSESAATNAWKHFTLAREGGLAFLPPLAGYLRALGSGWLLDQHDSFDFDAVAGDDLEHQAKALGRFCARADSVTPFSLTRALETLDRRLMPLVLTWGFRSYLNSPEVALYPSVTDNTVRFKDEITALMKAPPPGVPIPCHERFLRSLFRIHYICETTRDFVEQSSKQMLRPLALGAVGGSAPLAAIHETRRPYRIGMATQFWCPDHPVHRCLSPMVHRLADEGHILHFYFTGGTEMNKPDLSVISPPHRVVQYPWMTEEMGKVVERMHGDMLRDRLDLLFYPDIGMSIETALLAQLRIAGVQAVGYGNPVTTGSDCIDYFVGGEAIEDAESAREYSERLVLIPGLGVCSTEPLPPSPRQRGLGESPVRLVNLNTYIKHNAHLCSIWNEIMERSQVPVELHLFPNLDRPAAASMLEKVAPLFPGKQVFIHCRLNRRELLDQLAEGDLYLEGFPFGGYNSLLEVLSNGMAPVCMWGPKAPSRFAAAIVRLLDLPSWLIVHTREEYVEAALRLIANTGERLEIRERLTRERVIAKLCRGREPEHFAAAVDWMIQQGPRQPRGDPRPVVIQAGSTPRFVESQS